MQFTKMQGAGNDYVYIDCFAQPTPADIDKLAIAISDRHFGVGGDGLVLIQPSEIADARMRMFNADGSESEMCGNAIRCVAKYLYDHDIRRMPTLNIETGVGVLKLELQVEGDRVHQVTVNMGKPILEASQVPTTILPSGSVVDETFEIDGHTLSVTCVSMGNPHCVCFVESATDELVLGLGPKIEVDPRFPNRTNVEFVEVINRGELRQRTWERGAGETWACGTGASAVCAAAVLTGRADREVLIHLLGGDLRLRWDETSGEMFKTGPAVEVFSGQWNA
ncbi:Diaminopimelate epimerase [Rosistilla carotiformis]|uniref:Diaminopimelate epimerase n=1 Tax=Rosistilla carotiformis TaxID=2528017 RepID=A0A518JW79_9BACT|nr:diaminopimelate epimerase [Rosistilla carotiformis]QDV69797.1 Diaminopimelate epimerase [Rosistilla carotiformis]